MEIIKFSTALKLYPEKLIDSDKIKSKINFLTNSTNLDNKVFPIVYVSGHDIITLDILNPSDVKFIDHMYRLAIVENDLIYLINPNILNWTEILEYI